MKWPKVVEHIDSAGEHGDGCIITLHYGWTFEPSEHEGVRGLETRADALKTTQNEVYPCTCETCTEHTTRIIACPDYPFVQTDAGRSASKRPKQTNDCTVRALALARSLSYDKAYDLLAALGRKCGGRFKFGEWLSEQTWTIKTSFPATKGLQRMNPVEFCKRFPAGTHILKTSKHVFIVRNGVVLDDRPTNPNRCIYAAWEVTQTE